MKTLLIVDDNKSYVNSLKNFLSDEFEIKTAYSLNEAKEKTDDKIDIFLVDIRLDEKDQNNADGIIFLEWVKTKYPEKPVIIMSAYLDQYKKDEIIKKGAYQILNKPVKLADLTNILKKLSDKS